MAILVQNDPSHGSLGPQIIDLAKSQNKDDQIRGILCLGEIGKLKDLSAETHILDLLLSNFNSKEDDIRQASSTSLGNLTIGNP